jgi:DNA topoisomerase-1
MIFLLSTMKLFIVESPSKAKTISKYLGSDFVVKSSIGHIRDLPKSNKKAISIEEGFVPHYEITPAKKDVVKELEELGKKAEQVYLATDPDREGEAIAWHLEEACDFKDPERITYHEITKEAILEALKKPRKIDNNLRMAQEARRVLDRLVGYDLSGIIWKKVRYGLSAGRVQSPALRILAEREREIINFIPEAYFVLEGIFEHNKKNKITAYSKDIWFKENSNEGAPLSNEEGLGERVELFKKAVEESKTKIWSVKDKKVSEQARNPRPPFTTSTLQQAASTYLGFAPSRTMRAAQKLYEAGLITYMRTDSTSLSAGAQQVILQYVGKKYGEKFAKANFYKTKSKNAQEAHEAIRPTNPSTEHVNIGKDESILYELIKKRTVASQMTAAVFEKTHIEIGTNNFQYILNLDGSRILQKGFLMEDDFGASDDNIIPEMKVGEILDLEKLNIQNKETTPPNRFSEAGLIKELEKRGIGRPSTYASIISTIVEREYVTKENKSLKPTEVGLVVSEFLENNFQKYISDDFTAEMENELDEIAEGKRKYKETLEDFYTPFLKLVKEKEKGDKVTNLGDAPADISCPICQSKMVIKLARNGTFYSCSRYPECTGALTLEGKQLEGPKTLDKICPKCGKNNLIERDGKNGKFVACSGYPKCKYVEKSEEQIEKEKHGVKCIVCKDGVMLEKRGRFGIFYACSNYPTCKAAIKSKPTGKLCTYTRENGICGHLMMEGTKTIPERCSDKTCPNHRPDKLEK